MPYQEITSRDNDRVKRAAKLARSAALRAEQGLFFAEGVRLCLDLVASQPPRAVFFTEKVLTAHPEVAELCEESFLVQPHVAEKLGATQNSQGLYCLFPLPHPAPETLKTEKGILLCEDIQDPSNLGAMLRSAAAFGFGAAVLAGACADPFSPKALRASAGAVARLPLYTGLAIGEAARLLKQRGATLWAAALREANPLGEAAPELPFALMVGNEGAGLSGEALALADRAVYIPMQGGVESLNAAVAASVLMYRFAAGS